MSAPRYLPKALSYEIPTTPVLQAPYPGLPLGAAKDPQLPLPVISFLSPSWPPRPPSLTW